MKSFTIRDLPVSERPRERLLKHGAEVLSTQEILSLILGRGIRSESVIVTAQRLLSAFGSLRGVVNASVEELITVKGIGIAKAAQIKAAFELGKRVDAEMEGKERTTVSTSHDIVRLIRTRLKDKKKEYFVSILLDSRNRVIKVIEVSIGSLDASIVHPREVFIDAISASAASMVLVHNHPSGDPFPSDEDIRLTKRLVEIGNLVGIAVLDHVIIAGNKHCSLKGQDLI